MCLYIVHTYENTDSLLQWRLSAFSYVVHEERRERCLSVSGFHLQITFFGFRHVIPAGYLRHGQRKEKTMSKFSLAVLIVIPLCGKVNHFLHRFTICLHNKKIFPFPGTFFEWKSVDKTSPSVQGSYPCAQHIFPRCKVLFSPSVQNFFRLCAFSENFRNHAQILLCF